MTKQARAILILRAQALRDTGMSAPDTAAAIGISQTWVNRHTKSSNTQFIARKTNTNVNPDIRDTCIYGICVAIKAVRLGCKPSKALDAVVESGLVRIGGVAF
jgi:predicted transcriptional regulator